jgi:hypothetical protein
MTYFRKVSQIQHLIIERAVLLCCTGYSLSENGNSMYLPDTNAVKNLFSNFKRMEWNYDMVTAL